MESLNLPKYKFAILKKDKKIQIFDPIRKKYVVLTPEEWVRQHFLNYLTEHLHFPRSLIRVEGGFHYNRMLKRSDIVVHGRKGEPLMLVECKAPGVSIDEKTMEQAAAYNRILSARFLVLTNGLVHVCCDLKAGSGGFLEKIPDWLEIS